jgi:hypothetical protein
MLKRICLVLIFMTSACTFRPNIISATANTTSASDTTIHVLLRKRDASIIKRRQLYFSIVAVNCKDGTGRFPVDPYIAGQSTSEFEFPLSADPIRISGSIPLKIWSDYRQPCVFLEGGGYFTGKIKSSLAPLKVYRKVT